MNKNEPNKTVLNELIDELIRTTVQDDLNLKSLDKSIDPDSVSYSVHLAKTIKEFISE